MTICQAHVIRDYTKKALATEREEGVEKENLKLVFCH